MITWMQKHKKWLVITIWISTIAFVGAGFVGWGSYDYGKSSSSVATVGNQEVTMTDLNSEYQTLYSRYQSSFGEMFNQEMAKQFKLEETAYNTVIQKFLILNYADELGFYVTDKEIAKYLVTIPSFQKDNKFDKTTYLNVLKQNRTTPIDFEAQITKDLLIQKVAKLFNTKVTQSEIKSISLLDTIKDKISLQIIDVNNFKFNIVQKDLKKYWEENKQNYKTKQSTKVSIVSHKISDDRKASKKEALKKYLKLKKGELKFTKTLNIDGDSTFLTSENLAKVNDAKNGTIIKPFENKGEFIIVKIISTVLPQVLSFEDAFKPMEEDYFSFKKHQMLNDKIQKSIANFKGKDIGYINQTSTDTIKGLNKEESAQLIQHIFKAQNTLNSVTLNTKKAVVYKITDSMLSGLSSTNTAELEKSLLGIKNNEIMTKLIEQLRNKYQVDSNFKVQ